ncbi:unnamed protein product [Thelazia callipaeda]|uniref:Uncharacterized protein n=1 Tax=Thelazia callipaeda TaxID=103827 RepID=A0A0N5DCG0_THECL|nr:unnamed protein product [Thelazia callipaeda]
MKCRTKIIPYVITWDGVVTNFHKRCVKQSSLSDHVEAYIQSTVLKKTPWIRLGRSENDRHNKSERRTSTAKVPECDPELESIERKNIYIY